MSENNALKGKRIEYHILQSFPVTCLNRDDVGAPKTAMVGGVIRSRVSSQCWKRQVRLALRDLDVKLGTRTKHIANLVTEACQARGATDEQAEKCGQKVEHIFIKAEKEDKKEGKADEASGDESEKTKTDTLIFLSPSEVTALAEAFKEAEFDPEKVIPDIKKGAKDIQKIIGSKINYAKDGLDIALFGRMVAQAAELNVEAAASFAHAISTHKSTNEVEFFTAMDDRHSEDPGAAHMGSLEFNAATYYRYVCLDLGQLYESLAGTHIAEAVEKFTRALFVAVPAARQTTQAGYCPWQFARVLVREGQRLQVPFDTPVKATRDEGFLEASKIRLKSFLDKQEKLWGSMFGKIGLFDYGEDDSRGIDPLVDFLKQNVSGK